MAEIEYELVSKGAEQVKDLLKKYKDVQAQNDLGDLLSYLLDIRDELEGGYDEPRIIEKADNFIDIVQTMPALEVDDMVILEGIVEDLNSFI